MTFPETTRRVVGQNVPHDSARGHASGESIFIDDIPPARGELVVDCFGSPVAHGRVKSLDLAAARQVPGIVDLFTWREVPGHNHFGPIVQDEHVLAEDTVTFIGDPLVLIAAESREALVAAKKLIKAEIEPLPPIFTVDEARAAGSFLGPERVIACGDIAAALAAAEHVIEGDLTIGGQEHFYFETQSAIVYPGEYGALEVHSSTQHTTEVQSVVAEVCGLPFHRVTTICKRMGGGFGGKETQAALPAAMCGMVATLTRRPARMVLGRDDDMITTGKRHPFKSWYKVGFTREGRITALEVNHFSNGGCATDLSPSVLERAMLHTDNAYFIENARITGRVCKTNLPSNTAFRGFGGPQGVAVIENIIEEIAHRVGKDAYDIRQLNCYGMESRNIAPYGEIVRNNTLPAIFAQLRATSDYDRRRADIARDNAIGNGHLRGLAMTPVKFGISFTKRTLNQANALVNIYTDGTVLVSTGGTEMGQGVNTRVRQLVADELGIEYDGVLVSATNTDKNNNTSPTAASAGTDLNGTAAIDACSRLKRRLAEFVAPLLADSSAGIAASPDDVQFVAGQVFDRRLPDRRLPWREVVAKAYFERVNLGERGFYATPGVDFNRETGKGHPFFYYTNGAAVTEVLIDRFTGELRVVRADLLMDIGVPVNPGIDRGQLVGGFLQGVGWVTTEELKYDAAGNLLSHSPTTYKIPNISDLPETFRLDLFPNPDNEVSLKRSKAVGEPPLLLGISAWAAVKNALAHVSGKELPKLSLPATGEEVLLRIGDYAQRAKEPVASDAKSM